MKFLVQRVKEARVAVNDEIVGEIGVGLLVFVGMKRGDTLEMGQKLFDKIVDLRIFAGEGGKIDKSLLEIGGEVLLVSQFTLYADTKKGRRPSFIEAMPPSEAEPLYNALCRYSKEKLGRLATGRFGAMMEVSLANDGPFTLVLEE